MVAARPIRILIVDDSAVMRCLLRAVVTTGAGLEVAGTAANGESALSEVESIRPDLVLLDVEMPVMDGLVTLKKLRACGHRMPVIMCSALTQRGARVTIEALAAGASDYVAKPTHQAGRESAIQALAQELVPKIYALTSRSQARQQVSFQSPDQGLFPAGQRASRVIPLAPPRPAPPFFAAPSVVAIGVSTGGPEALDLLLPRLSADFPLPVLIVQHMPEVFTGLFAERLNGRCRLAVHEAVEGEPVRPGNVYIARGNWHMEVAASASAGAPATLRLNQGAPENHCRPSVDVLFRSAATIYGPGVLAVVLTGMGSDGLAGCRAVRAYGGSVLAQDQVSSAVWGMPGAVAHAGLADRILPLHDLVPEILRLAARTLREASAPREAVV
jgi:two-component system chemotaxis response regulator CheB